VEHSALSADECGSVFDEIVNNVARVVHGKRPATETAVATLFAGGHLLIEDVPGVGKTSLAKALAASVKCSWKRVQFTPDLLPSDLVGVNIYRRTDETFRFAPGPLFANIVLADEINRASPKTQSALLEAMEEHHITVDGTQHLLPEPFMVIATQNPIESDGTYRLPESQIDRFMSRISLGYPDPGSELEMLEDHGSHHTLNHINSVVDAERLAAIIAFTRTVHISHHLKSYLVTLTTATRTHPGIKLGLSPRATLQLAATSRARAVAARRDYAIPEDVMQAAIPTLAHRLTLTPEHSARSGPESVIREILDRVPVPHGN
jgi:MoxR-like ATPase